MFIKNILLKIYISVKKVVPDAKLIPIYFSVSEIKKKKHFSKDEIDILLDFELSKEPYTKINTDAVELYLDICSETKH